jgi:hypothetical protein
MTASPITTAYLDLPSDIRSRAEEIAGNNRPVTWPEVLLLVGWGMALERERCISVVIDAANAGKYTPLSELAPAIRGDETEREAIE